MSSKKSILKDFKMIVNKTVVTILLFSLYNLSATEEERWADPIYGNGNMKLRLQIKNENSKLGDMCIERLNNNAVIGNCKKNTDAYITGLYEGKLFIDTQCLKKDQQNIVFSTDKSKCDTFYISNINTILVQDNGFNVALGVNVLALGSQIIFTKAQEQKIYLNEVALVPPPEIKSIAVTYLNNNYTTLLVLRKDLPSGLDLYAKNTEKNIDKKCEVKNLEVSLTNSDFDVIDEIQIFCKDTNGQMSLPFIFPAMCRYDNQCKLGYANDTCKYTDCNGDSKEAKCTNGAWSYSKCECRGDAHKEGETCKCNNGAVLKNNVCTMCGDNEIVKEDKCEACVAPATPNSDKTDCKCNYGQRYDTTGCHNCEHNEYSDGITCKSCGNKLVNEAKNGCKCSPSSDKNCECEENEYEYENSCRPCPAPKKMRASKTSCECEEPKIFDPESSACDYCKDDTFFKNSDCVKCIDGSPNADHSKCVCASDAHLVDNKCITCESDEHFDGSSQKCVCNIGEHTQHGCEKCADNMHMSGDRCVACGSNMIQNPTDQTLCVCKNGYELQGQKCVACQSGYYTDSTSGKCQECPPNEIVNDAMNGCVECDKGMIRVDNKCTCDDKIGGHMFNGRCVICPSSDNLEFNSSTGDCDCRIGYFKSKPFTCVECGKNQIVTLTGCQTCENGEPNDERTLCVDSKKRSSSLSWYIYLIIAILLLLAIGVSAVIAYFVYKKPKPPPEDAQEYMSQSLLDVDIMEADIEDPNMYVKESF